MKAVVYTDKISRHFTYHEALWLPHWNRHGDESDGLTVQVLSNLAALFAQIDQVRDFFAAPLDVHCAWRPVAYNALPAIGGAFHSAHLALENAAAIDFSVQGLNCDEARKRILDASILASYGLRMEDRPGSDWIHLDNRALLPSHPRFFKP